MAQRVYDKLKNFEDKTRQSFSAEDLKQLQDVMNHSQKEIIVLHDINFEKQALFVLNNTDDVNSVYIETFDNYEFIDRNRSKNIRLDKQKNCILCRDKTNEGIMVSFEIQSGNDLEVQKLMLLTDDFTPDGTRVEYFISNDGYKFQQITPNVNKLTAFETVGRHIKIIINLYPNNFGESPEIYTIGILYQNDIVERKYGLGSLSLPYKPSVVLDADVLDVYIIRDVNLKVIRVLDNNSVTNVIRNLDDAVETIISTSNLGDRQTTTLIRESVQGENLVTRIRTERETV